MRITFLKLSGLIPLFIFSVVQASDRSWTSPVCLSDEPLESWCPVVATNSQSDFVLWRLFDGDSQRAAVKRFSTECEKRHMPGSWDPAATYLSQSVTGQGAYDEKIAADCRGNAWAIWRQVSGLTNIIMASRFTPDQGWLPIEMDITLSDTSKNALYPAISMSKSGRAVACWTWDTMVQAITAKRDCWRNPATTLSMPDAHHPDCAINQEGKAIVVWERFNTATGHYQIETSNFSHCHWHSVTVLSDGTQNAYRPRIAMDDSGYAIVVWYEGDPSNFRVMSSIKVPCRVWTSPKQLSGTGPAKFPVVAMNEDGHGIVLWEQYSGAEPYNTPHWHIASRYIIIDNCVWEHEKAASAPGHDAFDPQVALYNCGCAIAVWQIYDDATTPRIQKANFYIVGRDWTPIPCQHMLSPENLLSQSPSLALDPYSGHAIVAWQSFIHNDVGAYWSIQATQIQHRRSCNIVSEIA